MANRLCITILLILITFIISGCGSSEPGKTIRLDDPAQPAFHKLEGDRSVKLADTKPQSDAKPLNKEPDEKQPDVNKNTNLDASELSKLDNTRYAWWLTLNTKHQTPGIPGYASKLAAKHDAVWVGDTSRKVIYLTFDEGYENGYTPVILDTLKKNNVKALFFITGPYLNTEQKLVKRMLDEGHLVGNHTINHPSLPDMTVDKLDYEMRGLEKQFNTIFGKGFKYMRPPKGEYSERTLEAARELGYKTVFWSFAYADYDVNKQQGPNHAYNMVMGHLHNGAVLLLHAVSKDNAEALDRIIKGIRDQGYEIAPFDL